MPITCASVLIRSLSSTDGIEINLPLALSAMSIAKANELPVLKNNRFLC